ncbi:unnamed protein product, partial [Scytosiphon promiscuus]
WAPSTPIRRISTDPRCFLWARECCASLLSGDHCAVLSLFFRRCRFRFVRCFLHEGAAVYGHVAWPLFFAAVRVSTYPADVGRLSG